MERQIITIEDLQQTYESRSSRRAFGICKGKAATTSERALARTVALAT